MEQRENIETPSSLELLESLVSNHYGETMSSFLATSTTSPFLSIWTKPLPESEGKYTMAYLPLFYVIASQDKESKLSLKLITFHGKVLEELNGFNNLLSNEDKINFISKLERMKLCEGVKMPDNDLKLDASTFSAMYLVERLEQNIIIRSQQCQYGLYDGSVCKMCASLNTAYNSSKVKYETDDMDNFYYDEALDGSQEEMFETEADQSLFGLSTVLEASNTNDEHLLSSEEKQGPLNDKTLHNTNQQKPKIKKSTKRGKLKVTGNKAKNEKQTMIKCKHCPHKTNDIKSLMLHNIEVHAPKFNGSLDNEDTGENIRCDECLFSTSIKKEYIEHITNYHDSGGTLFPCKLCDKVFGRKESLKTHMNTLHKRPYKCPSCPYETAQESRLTRLIKYVMHTIDFCVYFYNLLLNPWSSL